MYIRIIFEDRSNPYTRYCETKEKMEEELDSWRKHYELTEVKCTPSPYAENHFYTAKEKRE